MTKRPGAQDAQMLLHLLEIFVSDPVREARNFWRSVPAGLTFGELDQRYPPGTEAYGHIETVMVFWETVGSLIKRGLLSEDLAFDSFLDAPPWKKLERAILEFRKESGRALEGENIEFAYLRSVEWKRGRRPTGRTRANA